MNHKATLKKLHEVFPEFDIETIIKILDCYVDDYWAIPNRFPNTDPSSPLTTNPPSKPWENIIYCTDTIQTTTF